VLSATADRVAEKLVEKPKPTPDVVLGAQLASPNQSLPPSHSQSGSGKRKSSHPLYKTLKTKKTNNKSLKKNKQLLNLKNKLIYNF